MIIQATARGWAEHKKNWEQEEQLAASDDSQEVIRTKAGVNRFMKLKIKFKISHLQLVFLKKYSFI